MNIKISTDRALTEDIYAFSTKNKRMPKLICGTFVDLYPIGQFNSFTNFLGKSGIYTPFGLIELKLDADAKSAYLE